MRDDLPYLDKDIPDDPPPFLGTWGRVYLAVLLYLAIIIFAFYLFTEALSP
jgi:hypothetical protein